MTSRTIRIFLSSNFSDFGEERDQGDVLPICLAEIDRPHLYFIGMLGERYGCIPLHA